MAKSSRSSTRKANNQRLAAKVFGPAQAAREERLSAKLLEVAKQPKPESSDVNMNILGNEDAADSKDKAQEDEISMDVDPKQPKEHTNRNRIGKRKQKKTNKIVFQKYGDRQRSKK